MKKININPMKIHQMSCSICLFESVEKERCRCCEPHCMGYICSECLETYLDVCEKENILVECPTENCDGVFDEECLGDRHSYKITFRRLLYNHYKIVKKTDISNTHKQRAIINLMKEEKRKFLVESMPRAVSDVAKICFRAKINKVKTIQEGRDKKMFSRTCINLVCNGFLDLEFKCCKCSSVFCKSCEEKIIDDSHVCNEDMVESVKAVNNMVSCPCCKTKIEHADGCLAITCAVCKTNFWYSTGLEGDHGNHGKYVSVKVKMMDFISREYASVLTSSQRPLIIELERVLKISNGEDKLYAILFRNSEGAILPNFLKSFSEAYSYMVRTSMKIRHTIKKLTAIESLLKKKEEGYENNINVILFGEKVTRCTIVANTLSYIILGDEVVYENIYTAATDMGIIANEIRRCIETGNNIYENYFWKY